MSRETSGFFRKVVRFVANPTTEWSSLDTDGADAAESEYAKSEIKAMIERKRRNDFVRKRELDMLRKIRREGLSQDAALALNTPSNLDPDSRPQTNGAPSDITIKAKIDEIELEMVGGGNRPPVVRQSAHAPTLPLGLMDTANPAAVQAALAATEPVELDEAPQFSQAVIDAARDVSTRMAAAPAPVAPHTPAAPLSGFYLPPDSHVIEMVHDPELDEAVIAFANADFDQCERCILDLIQADGSRHDNTETWMVLFDFYRALDLPQQFDNLVVSFVEKFGVSAPQWYSLPQKVARFLEQQAPRIKLDLEKAAAPQDDNLAAATSPNVVEGWVAPERIDSQEVVQLRAETLQLPRPWVMDWSSVKAISPEGAAHLGQAIRQWAREPIELKWIGADKLLTLLGDTAPTGSRSADPAYWMLRLDLLRMCNNPIEFDEVAIDYCVTYELSPPSWEPAACKVTLMNDAISPQTRSLTHVSQVITSFVESQFNSDIEFVQVAALNLSGQLVGDIGTTLAQLDSQLGASVSLDIDCQHLLRVDFIAAGDLLNWVLARRGENRQVTFHNPHRLIALFFGAMGINEHAHVKLQMV